MNVIVYGPNLGTAAGDEAFHVHLVGCADTHRGIYRHIRTGGDQGGWTLDASSQQEIVEDIYADMIGESDPEETWEDGYRQDVRIFPCVDLPVFADDGDAPDCSGCGASNAGSRKAPHLCETCES